MTPEDTTTEAVAFEVYDDDIAEAAADAALDAAMSAVQEQAREDAPRDFCAYCADITPLAYDNASDISTIKVVDGIVEMTAQLQHLLYEGGVLKSAHEAAVAEDWVRTELVEAYEQAYWHACAAPEECEVCTHPDSYGECGHEQTGEPCPARADDGEAA